MTAPRGTRPRSVPSGRGWDRAARDARDADYYAGLPTDEEYRAGMVPCVACGVEDDREFMHPARAHGRDGLACDTCLSLGKAVRR